MDEWRLIEDGSLSGGFNMAVDETLLDLTSKAALAGDKPRPVLRLYGWSEPTLSLGYAQNSDSLTKRSSLSIVRRVTGGRAVLHDNELTYSIIVPASSDHFDVGITETYALVSRAITEALKGAGVPALLASFDRSVERTINNKEACFLAPSRFEITADDRKLVGSAQRRLKGAFLQHGSILFDIDEPLTEETFGEGVFPKMACVSEFSDISTSEFSPMLVSSIAEHFGASFTASSLSAEELKFAKGLAEEKGLSLKNGSAPVSSETARLAL